jgi:hypothetical protein
MMRTTRLTGYARLLAIPVLLGAGTSCMSLDVTNPNDPDRQRVLETPGDVETLIRSTFLIWWNKVSGESRPGMMLSAIADEMSTTFADFAMLDMSSEPRRAWDNNPSYASASAITGTWFDLNTLISNVNDGLRAIDRGMEIGPVNATTLKGADTPRARAFGKFTQALATGYLGLVFDKAFIADEDTDIENYVPELRPYPEVIAAAISQMEEAIEIADANTFTLGPDWVNGVTLTNQDLSKLGHSFIARFIAYSPRSRVERKAADWNTVLTHLNSAITADFGPMGRAAAPTYESRYKFNLQRANFAMADNHMLGPADTSGAYQAWVATPVAQRREFEIKTSDRRITGDPTGAANPERVKGLYFNWKVIDMNRFNASRGTYHFSYYWNQRFNNQLDAGHLVTMTVDEMRLLKAEALFWLGNEGPNQQVADLLNVTRVGKGKLPAITAVGPPAGTGCVPRKPTGECGTLYDALMYEIRIEMAGIEGPIQWFNGRGLGWLVSGTPVHFPVPGRELNTLGLPLYTFGGAPGQPGSAP